MSKQKLVKAFEIVSLDDPEQVVHTVPVDPPGDYLSPRIMRIEAGLVRKADPDRFFVREIYAE